MISNLVANLPEVYQPIFGHPELSEQVSRPCDDRLLRIIEVCDALQVVIGRPLRVLDLGCAQGFFSFSLAERGADVHGIDFLDKNIELCSALASERAELSVTFEVARVEEVIRNLEVGEYDLVLGLSVFHHIVHANGVDEVRNLIRDAARKCGVLLIETALRDEAVYWGEAQPTDPRLLFENVAFIREVARHETHLGPVLRPLFVVSDKYFILSGFAEQFDYWSENPHDLAHGTHEGSRRYYFNDRFVMKIYRFDHPRGAHNRLEYKREIEFLKNVPSGYRAPKCYAFGENEVEGWVVLERLPGRLLVDVLREGYRGDRRRLLLNVLEQCEILESEGLYHGDVRAWNVLVEDDGSVYLIDVGSISSASEDCVWPRNIFFSFLIFAHEIVGGVVDDPSPIRTIGICPIGMPEPYRSWGRALWMRPLNEWTFALLRKSLDEVSVVVSGDSPVQPIEAWMVATEEAIHMQKIFSNGLQEQIKSAPHVEMRDSKMVRCEACETAAGEVERLRNWALEVQEFAKAQTGELSKVRADVEGLRRARVNESVDAEEEFARLRTWAQESEGYANALKEELAKAKDELDAVCRARDKENAFSAEQIARLTTWAEESEKAARAQSAELEAVRKELEALGRVRENESVVAEGEFARLREWARESEGYANALKDELAKAKDELDAVRGARDKENAISAEQIARLTTWAEESERAARARSAELEAVRKELEALARVRENESVVAEGELARLREWARESEGYANALKDELAKAKDELDAVRQARHDEVMAAGLEIRRLGAEIQSFILILDQYEKSRVFRLHPRAAALRSMRAKLCNRDR